MRTVRLQIAAACIAYAGAGLVRADLAARPAAGAPAVAPHGLHPLPVDGPFGSTALGERAVGGLVEPESDLGLPDFRPAADDPQSSSFMGGHLGSRHAGGTNTLYVPASPSSTAMFLSALLSIGAWHALRSASQVHWAPAPEWFHTGGPDQIGHTVLYDFQGAPALCFWDEPVDPPAFFRVVRVFWEVRHAAQSISLEKAPRGPPVVA